MSLNLKKRIPEPMQEMEGLKEAKNYFLAHKNRHKKRGSSYDLVARDILKHVKNKKGEVLDVGCGYGALMEQLYIYNKKFNLTGIDISKAMIKIANQYSNLSNSRFRVMPADKITFNDGKFDVVICKDTFHHFDNPVKALKEMFRVTKKGGNIYITDLRRDSTKKVIFQVIQELAENNIFNAIQYIDSIKASYTISEMEKLLKKANIKTYKIWKPKIGKNFINNYNVNSRQYLSAINYFLDRWSLIIKK